MLRVGAIASLQAAGPEGGATLTLGTWGVVFLAALLFFAAAGWVLYALSRRPPASLPAPPPLSPPLPPPAMEDPLEAAFQAAESGLGNAVLMCRESRVTRAGSGVRDLLGVDPARLEGLSLSDLLFAEDLLPLAEALRKLGERAPGSVESQLRLVAPGARAPREVSLRLVRPAGAPARSFIAVLTDIGGAAALARGAAEMVSRVDEAIRMLRDGILLTRFEEGREVVLLTNRGFEEIFGVEAGSLAGRTLQDLRRALGASFSAKVLADLFVEVEAPRPEIVEAGGEPARLIERSCRTVGQGSGAPGRLFVFRDVTGERAREEDLNRAAPEAAGARESPEIWQEQLQLANEGLERRVSGMARLNKELRALDEMKSNLLANVSHELQTPLVSIKGYTEIILKGRLGPLTQEQERGLQAALRNVDRLIRLIEGVLTFARAERESQKLRISTFPLGPLVEEVVNLLKDLAAGHRVSVRLEFPSGDMMIRGDRDRIAQVFINLLANAFKYSKKEGGGVVIEAAPGSRSTVRVEVRDTGVGIAREDLEKIFDRFYRGGGAEGEGTGLGLSIAKDILRLHGCTIRAESEPGRGSTFSFTLPLEPRARSGGAPPMGGRSPAGES